jgi:hypothetical protein
MKLEPPNKELELTYPSIMEFRSSTPVWRIVESTA